MKLYRVYADESESKCEENNTKNGVPSIFITKRGAFLFAIFTVAVVVTAADAGTNRDGNVQQHEQRQADCCEY